MIDAFGSGDAAMNLIGLFLIAALSGGIVAVSLLLRAASESTWIEADPLRGDGELHKAPGVKGSGAHRLTDPFRLEGQHLYNSARDQLGN